MQVWSLYEYSKYSKMLLLTTMGPATFKLSFADAMFTFKVYISHGLALAYKCD